MGQPQIFISYRRDDAAGYARAIHDELSRSFGAERVFIDVDDIDAGQPFSDVIQHSVGGSAVLLALIGKRWQGERERAPPRICESGDLVRQEIAAGLATYGVRVIPVLVDGAAMPEPAHLPVDLRALAGRNALELDNTRFAADMAHLVREVRDALGGQARPPARRMLTTWWLAGAAVAVAATLALWQWRSPAPGEQARASAARPPVNGEWRAEVDYDWDNAHHVERFVFAGDGDELHGSASFLGVPRGVLDSRVDGAGLRFVTRTSELPAAGGTGAEVVHRYRGRLVDDELRFVMQTEGGSSVHVPVEFVARRVAASASQATR